jgi:putative endonuclease
MFYVYLLKSALTGTKYIGCTSDLKNRLNEHNSGKNNSTKNKIPWKLVYYEAFMDKYDAFNREKELKNDYTKKRHLLNRLKNSLQE